MHSPRRILLPFASLMLLASLVGPAAATPQQDITDTVKESFEVRPGGTLMLDLDRGNVDVVTRRGDVVVVEMERVVDAGDREEAKAMLERHSYTWERSGDDVAVRSRFDTDDGAFWRRWRGGERFRLRVTVQVPANYNVRFESGAGNVRIGSLNGFVEGRTGAGNIEIAGVRGRIDVLSGSGNVEIDRVEGDVDVRTGAGNIELRDVAGYVEATTGAGNVYAEITGQPRADSRLESGAGNVTVAVGERVGVNVNATSGMGSATTDFPLTVEGKWMSKSIEGRINGGGPLLRMRAGVGNVSVLRR